MMHIRKLNVLESKFEILKRITRLITRGRLAKSYGKIVEIS